MKTSLRFHIAPAALGIAIASIFMLAPLAHAQTTVFSDGFNNPVGTPINGKSATIGGTYNVTDGATGLAVALDGQNGNASSYISDGARREVYVNFNTGLGTLSATTPLLTVVDGNFFRNGVNGGTLAGLSLYSGLAGTNPGGATERVFLGDRNGAGNSSWGFEFAGGGNGPGVDAANFSGQ